jgi:hypothetical protein
MSTLRRAQIRKTLIVLPTFAAVLATTTGAFAYNNREHERWPDQAYQLLNIVNRGAFFTERVAKDAAAATPPLPAPVPLTTRPASVPASEQALWDRFVAEMRAAAPKLDQLLVDLPNPNRPSAECGNAYPVLASGGQLAQCRAGELPFAPRRHWNENEALCYLRRGYQMGDGDKPEFFASLPSRNTGALLGYYSQAVDDETKDSVLTVRITNLGFAGAAKGVAEDALELGLTILLAPFVCIGEFIFGGSDCLDDAANLAHDADVIARIDEIIPDGVGQIESDSYTGLWHYLNVGHSGEFNNVPGMSYLDGGVNGIMDAFDIAIVVGTDLAGLTLDPDSALGPKRYGQYADGPKNRRKADYWSTGIGHVEFEPLDNLALYGWNRFASTKGASGLGWVLHALGDALAPHHTVAATGWGHRAYENYAGMVWAKIFHEGLSAHYADFSAALVHAYHWWRFIDDRTGGNNATAVPMKAFIEAIATETRGLPAAASTWIPGISVPFQISGEDGNLARTFYAGQEPNVFDLATRSMGATIAFLTKAGAFLTPVPATAANDPCLCPTGQARLAVDLAGKIFRNDACLACGTGIFASAPLWLDGQCVASCPSDKPLVTNGACAAVCPIAGSCTGTVCPPSLPFVSGTTCVVRCAASEVVVDNRICATTCPSGQTADAQGFCRPPGGPGVTPICGGQAIDETTACCVPRAGLCTTDAHCCSQRCSEDGICKGKLGDSCSFGSDCVSNVCENGTCGKAHGLGPCVLPEDCLSNVCGNNICSGILGDPCGSCTVGICENASDPPAAYGNCCLPTGSACTAGGCCSGLSCQSGVCATTQPEVPR